jgi:hypothetical protein
LTEPTLPISDAAAEARAAAEAAAAAAAAERPSLHPLHALFHPGTVRARCAALLSAVERDLSPHFRVDRERLDAVADRVAALTRQRFPDLKVPLHSRWRHFDAGGVERTAELDRALAGRDPLEAARARFDLTVISVLLDAGAGPRWSYIDGPAPAAGSQRPLHQRDGDELLALLDAAAPKRKPSAAAAAANAVDGAARAEDAAGDARAADAPPEGTAESAPGVAAEIQTPVPETPAAAPEMEGASESPAALPDSARSREPAESPAPSSTAQPAAEASAEAAPPALQDGDGDGRHDGPAPATPDSSPAATAAATPEAGPEAPPGATLARSEGLAVASLRAFMAGAFSGNRRDPLRVDASTLQLLDVAALRALFQVTPLNPLDGLDGRAELMRRLGEVLATEAAGQPVAARPALIFDRLTDHGQRRSVSAAELLAALLRTLAPIWPSGQRVQSLPAGDVWPHRWAGDRCDPQARATGRDATTLGWLPLHKLSQWLAYSLVEPLAAAGVEVTGLDELTALAEYRNGGLLIDAGVIVPRNPNALGRNWKPGDEFVVEWRALTVALIDELAPRIRARLGPGAEGLSLGSLLEGGTWAAGRAIAQELRDDGRPPLRIEGEGTLF